MTRLPRLLGLLIVAAPLATCADKQDRPPVSVFGELEGTWEGTFVGYDVTGKELYRIAATHTYRTVDAETQAAVIEDRMPDGTLIRATGANIARRNDAGNLEIWCNLEKSNGERIQHRGRLVRGPLGTTQFIWYSSSDDRSETFRESVSDDGGRRVYQIDGMGKYGDTLILMAGRYRKVDG